MKIKKLNPDAEIPTRMTEGSAGLDLTACLSKQIVLYPNQSMKIGTGIAIEIEENNQCAIIVPRSSIATHNGLVLKNTIGVIDSDYRGEIIVPLYNRSGYEQKVFPGMRIAQLLLVPIININPKVVEELSDTDRGDGGFGSTGESND